MIRQLAGSLPSPIIATPPPHTKSPYLIPTNPPARGGGGFHCPDGEGRPVPCRNSASPVRPNSKTSRQPGGSRTRDVPRLSLL